MKELTLASFVTHLAEVAVAAPLAINAGLNRAAQHIEDTAKAKIGAYQAESGPFPAWRLLDDSTEEEKERLGYEADAPLLREGDLCESVQHEVAGLEAVIGSQSPIAAYQEFGTATIPPRPFVGPAAFESKDKIIEILGEAVVTGLCLGGAIPSGHYDFKV